MGMGIHMTNAPESGAQSRQLLKILAKGFAGFDMRLLDGVVKLSQRRNPVLELVTDPAELAVDVVMVDGKDAQAVEWAAAQSKWLAAQSVVWVDAPMEIPVGHTGVKRPLQWTNLPALLSCAMDDAMYHKAGLDIDFDLPAPPRPSAASYAGASSTREAPPSGGMPAQVPAATQLAGRESAPVQEQVRAGQDVPVLIVDDSAAVRAHLSVVLQSYGYAVTAAESGEAGVVAAGSLDYACVLMDVLMPGMDGYDACRRIKAMRQQGKRPPPIVMLTSRSSPFDRIRGKMAGCDAYLTKPVEKSYLLEILAQHVHKNGVVSAT